MEYQREQRPGQDSDFSDSDSEYHGNHGNTANHFLKGKVNFTVLGEEYLPGFAKERFRLVEHSVFVPASGLQNKTDWRVCRHFAARVTITFYTASARFQLAARSVALC